MSKFDSLMALNNMPHGIELHIVFHRVCGRKTLYIVNWNKHYWTHNGNSSSSGKGEFVVRIRLASRPLLKAYQVILASNTTRAGETWRRGGAHSDTHTHTHTCKHTHSWVLCCRRWKQLWGLWKRVWQWWACTSQGPLSMNASILEGRSIGILVIMFEVEVTIRYVPRFLGHGSVQQFFFIVF